MHCDDSAKHPVKCLSFLLGFTSLLRKERKAKLLFRPDVMFVVQYLHTVSPESNKPRGEPLLQAEMQASMRLQQMKGMLVTRMVTTVTCQGPGSPWRHKGLLAAVIVAGTALGTLTGAFGG